MNQEEYYSHLKAWTKSQHTELLNSEKYDILSIHILLQLLNLMENQISTTHFVPYKPNIELISLYKEYLTYRNKISLLSLLNPKKILWIIAYMLQLSQHY